MESGRDRGIRDRRSIDEKPACVIHAPADEVTMWRYAIGMGERPRHVTRVSPELRCSLCNGERLIDAIFEEIAQSQSERGIRSFHPRPAQMLEQLLLQREGRMFGLQQLRGLFQRVMDHAHCREHLTIIYGGAHGSSRWRCRGKPVPLEIQNAFTKPRAAAGRSTVVRNTWR